MKDSLITLATYYSVHEANFVLSALREASIPAFLEGEMTASAFAGNFGMGQQIRLLIARSDWKRSADILSGLDEVASAIDWDDASVEEGFWYCTQCDEAVENGGSVCPWCGTELGGASGW